MTKLIIFDWDDVITLGAKEAYFRLYRHTLDSLGIHLDPDEERRRILARWSKPNRLVFELLLEEYPGLVDRACEIYTREKDSVFLTSLHLPKGTNRTLKILSNDYILAVVSSNTKEMIRGRIIPYFGIPDVFSEIVSSHDLDRAFAKPHPRMIQLIMDSQKIVPPDTLYVGDAPVDMVMARNANVGPVAVLSGQMTEAEAKAMGLEWIIPDITYLPTILSKMG
jgi:phosphoglycolate phosphatase-like HAD superfamily hydrolase